MKKVGDGGSCGAGDEGLVELVCGPAHPVVLGAGRSHPEAAWEGMDGTRMGRETERPEGAIPGRRRERRRRGRKQPWLSVSTHVL